MALNARKLQKKQQRRKAKEKARRRASKQREPSELERAAGGRILHCCATDQVWERGMGEVLLCRELPDSRVGFGMFLMDMFCLGAKNAMYGVVPRADYQRKLYEKLRDKYELVPLNPACARKLVEGGVTYARDLSFGPHPDYKKARVIFGDIDAGACQQEFEYGKDGKPYFIAGPDDDPARCERIINTLTERCGPDGFHYLMPAGGLGTVLGGSAPGMEDVGEV